MTFVTFEEGQKQRRVRKAKASQYYRNRYAISEYMDFMRRNLGAFSISEVHPQDENRPEVYCLFTIPSQHVYGDCLEELLDKAIGASVNGNDSR